MHFQFSKMTIDLMYIGVLMMQGGCTFHCSRKRQCSKLCFGSKINQKIIWYGMEQLIL
jgi:hypothetical protein